MCTAVDTTGVRMITPADADFPALLREIADPPQRLYIRGRLPEGPAVAIVGSRRASAYGLDVAERLAYDLALRGVVIVSGLARGIDGAAHRGCLRAGGRTVAVLGSGLGRIYPPEHEALAEEIVRQRGAVCSEHPADAEPLPHHFPRRNRLISGLSLGVVVVEATARSGALITADSALEQGREVFAVPGPVTHPGSQGTHGLLKQGARLVACAEDILEELRLAPVPAAPDEAAVKGSLSAAEAQLVGCVAHDTPQDVDTLSQRSGLAWADFVSALLELEVKGLVRQLPGQRYVRAGGT